MRLATEKNIDYVLTELKEYASEVDVEFVRRAINAIGRIAVKMDRATERCISALLDLIKTKVNYVVQEAIVVIKVPVQEQPSERVWLYERARGRFETGKDPAGKGSTTGFVVRNTLGLVHR